MSAITWSEALALQQPHMDRTHQEFITLLQALEERVGAGLSEVQPRFDELVRHTEAHFAQEERWMSTLGFAPENCHAFQHAHVLRVLRELQGALAGERDLPGLLGQLVKEMAQWFTAHAQTMDAALAQTMVERGFDPDSGEIRNPPAADAALITGCGGASCG
jgi:hemerythrin